MEHPFTQFPVHLYHAELDPLIANSPEDVAEAEKKGYSRTYIPREYPKYVGGRVVNNAEEEKAANA